MNRWLSKTISTKELPWTFTWFYGVGLVLFMISFTRPLFISLIPLSLLLVIGIIFYHHRAWNAKTIAWFVFIYMSSFLLEMVGVNTGMIFGPYIYDRGLGWQINGTPLIIGLNWLFLVYASHDIASQYLRNPFLKILCGALLMILYDLIMEWAAPFMQMWHFDGGYPTVSNFLAWFLTAFIFHTGFEILHIRSDNPCALWLFMIQIIFFIFIGLFSLLVII